MASKYWTGGTGNWSDTTRWKTTSGGTTNAGVPTSADFAVFDANSGPGDFSVNIDYTGSISQLQTPVGMNKIVSFVGTGGTITCGSMSINGASNSVGVRIATPNITCSASCSVVGTGLLQIDGVNFTTGVITATTTNLVSSLNNGSITITGNSFGIAVANYTGTLPFRVYFPNPPTGTTTISNYAGTNNVFQIYVTGGGNTVAFSSPTTSSFYGIDFTGFSGTWSQSGSVPISYSLVMSPTMVTANSSGSGIAIYLINNSTLTVKSNGVQFKFSFIINAASGTLKLLDDLSQNTLPSGGSLTTLFTHTTGTLDLNGFALTVQAFSSSGTAARTIAFGTTGAINVNCSGSTTSIVFSVNGTSLTTTGTKQINYNASSSATGVVNASSMTETNAFNFTMTNNCNMGGVTAAMFNNFTISSGTPAFTTSCPTIYGNLTVNGGTAGSIASSGYTFAGSGAQTVYVFNSTYSMQFLVNKPSGTLKLLSNITSLATITATLTSGTIDLNGYTLTSGAFVSTSTSTRGVIGNNGAINVNSPGGAPATLWNIGVTGFTATNVNVIVSSTAPSGSRTLTPGAPTEANAVSFDIYGSSSQSVSFTTGSVIKNLTIEANASTSLAGLSTIYGNISVNYPPTLTTNVITLAGSSGQTITTNGSALQAPLSLANTSVAGVKLLSAVTMTTSNSTAAITLTSGLLDLNGFTLTIGIFNSNNSNVRSINFNGGSIVLTCTNIGLTTLWETSTTTNFTIAGTSDPLVYLNNTTTYARNLNPGTPAYSGSVSFYISPTTSIAVTIQSGAAIRNLTFNGSFTFTNIPLTIYGNYTYTAGTISTGVNKWTFAAPSGKTQTITTNGQVFNWPIEKTDLGNFILGSDLTLGSTISFILTQGTVTTSLYTLTIPVAFTSDNTNVRGINVSSSGGGIVLTGGNQTIWLVQDTTNFTFTGTGVVSCTYATASGTRSIYHGNTAKTAAGAVNFTVTGADTLNLFGSAKAFILSGYSGTLNNNAVTIYGNYYIGPSTTPVAGTNPVTFSGTSGTIRLTTSAKTIDFPLIVDGAGVTVQLTGSLRMATGKTLSLVTGTFDSYLYAVYLYSLNASGTGVRSLLMGSGLWTIFGTGTVWDFSTSTNATITAGTANIVLTDDTTASRTFAGGGGTYNKLTIGGNTSTSTTTITGNNTFSELASTKTVAHTLLLAAGSTTSVNTFSITGTAGNVVTLGSTGSSQATLTKLGGSTLTVNYMTISYSNGTPSNTWFANNSTDGGNNTGWNFGGAPVVTDTARFFLLFG